MEETACERCEQAECVCEAGERILKEMNDVDLLNQERERADALTRQLEEARELITKLQLSASIARPTTAAISRDTILKSVTRYSGKKEEFVSWCSRLKALLANAKLDNYLEEVERKEDKDTWSGDLTNNVIDNTFIYNLLILTVPDSVAPTFKRGQLGPYRQHGMSAYQLLRKSELGQTEVNIMLLETKYTRRKLAGNESVEKIPLRPERNLHLFRATRCPVDAYETSN